MPKTTTRNAATRNGFAFSVRVRDDAMRKRLQVAAKRADVSMTRFMRDAVYEAVERSENPPPKRQK